MDVMPSSYDKEIAGARMPEVPRGQRLTPAKFDEAFAVAASQSEYLLLIFSFLKNIPQDKLSEDHLHELHQQYLHLDYDGLIQSLNNIFKNIDQYLNEKEKEQWHTALNHIDEFLQGKRKISVRGQEHDEQSDSARRMFESAFAQQYLGDKKTLDNLKEIWTDQYITDQASVSDLMNELLNTTSSEPRGQGAWQYYYSHFGNPRELSQIYRGSIQASHSFRAREDEKDTTEMPAVKSPGIFKSTTPRPMYLYDQEITAHKRVSQSDKNRFELDESGSSPNWLTQHPNSPLVASYSGHTAWYLGLIFYICEKGEYASETTADKQFFVENNLKAFIAFYISQGYHAYQEIMTMIDDPVVLADFARVGVHLDPGHLFSDVPEALNAAFATSTDYNLTLLLKRASHKALIGIVNREGQFTHLRPTSPQQKRDSGNGSPEPKPHVKK